MGNFPCFPVEDASTKSGLCRIRVTGSSNLSGLVRDLDARTAFITSRGLWPKHVPGPQQKQEKNTCGFLPKPWEKTKETNRKVKWYQTKIKQLSWSGGVNDDRLHPIKRTTKNLSIKYIYIYIQISPFNQMKKRPQLKSKNPKWVFIVSYLHVWCGLQTCVSRPFLGCFELRFLYKRYLWAAIPYCGIEWELRRSIRIGINASWWLNQPIWKIFVKLDH